MKLDEISQTEFESMFGATEATNDTPPESPFSFQPTDSLFTNIKKDVLKEEIVEPLKPEPPKPDDTDPATEPVIDEEGKEKDDSLFKGDGKENPDEKTELDIKSYFDSRIKDGKFLPLEDGKLETDEDFDALIEANFEHKISEIREDLDKDWYESKSNAWKFVAKNAELFEKPQDLIPFLQGVETIEKVANLNPKELVDAEKLVRIALTKKGESAELIETQITSFKDTNTLINIAEQYQPALIKEENNRLAKIAYEEEQRDLRNLQQIQEVHQKAIEIIETPFLGKHKLKKEEKFAVYDLIAEPVDGGYRIFHAIDDLYAKQDFETLREIALLVAKKDAHRNYMGVTMSNQIAEGLLRKVKTSTSSNSSSPLDDTPPPVATPKLRPPTKESGFSFFQK